MSVPHYYDWDDGPWSNEDQEPPPEPRECWEYDWDEEPGDDEYARAMWDPREGWVDA